MDALRSFLSGRRLAIIGILLAIPFVFFGSSSFGTVFTNFGKVNGLTVSAFDVNIALNSVTTRLQNIYGEEFSVDTLEDGLLNNLVRNEIVSQKSLLYQAKQMNLSVTEDDAKRLIMSEPSFQVDGTFDQDIFEATIRANGILPNEYIENVQNGALVNDFLSAISQSNFQIKSEQRKLIRLIEQERDIEFFKIDFNSLKENINPSLENALDFYENNKLLFMDEEKRSFSIIKVSQDQFKDSIEVPEGFIEAEYGDYIERINALAERRISHIMIDVSNYETRDQAFKNITDIKERSNSEITFKDAVKQFSEDLISVDLDGDLGFSSGDSFPAEFEEALDTMNIGQVSDIIELDDTFHIIKFTEENKETPKSLEDMKDEFIDELIEAESYALMLDMRDSIEDLLLSGLSVEAISNTVNQEFFISDLAGYSDQKIFDDPTTRDFLFGIDASSDFAEFLELDNELIVASVYDITEPSVQSFSDVSDEVFNRVREDQASIDVIDLERDLILGMNDETFVLENKSVIRDNFISIKRSSTLFPSDVLSDIFSSKMSLVNSKKSFNSDVYIFKVININDPTEEFIESILPEYEEFSSSTSLVKLNLILEKELNKKIRDNIKNLNI
mgnify:FL=1|tara:strand:+ start:9241 stop:11091 length:1851 start_codon:yes stop_codon:yes gene_type:complete